MAEIELALKYEAIIGEGAIWDDRRQCLYWVDILGSKFFQYDPKANENKVFALDQYVTTIVPSVNENTAFLTMSNGFASFNLRTGELKPLGDPEPHLPDNRFNDGKCDPQGRFWAGTMSMNGEKYAGALYLLAEDGTIHKKIKNVSISNGLAWSLDGKTMYFIDTPTYEVVAYDFNGRTGAISNGRTIISVPESRGMPDGMTIDEEGMLWIAHWGANQVCRWDPDSGSLISSFIFPVSQLTSCAFGGENLDRLFVTSARDGLSDRLADEPLAGSLFVIENTGVKGVVANKCNVSTQTK